MDLAKQLRISDVIVSWSFRYRDDPRERAHLTLLVVDGEDQLLCLAIVEDDDLLSALLNWRAYAPWAV